MKVSDGTEKRYRDMVEMSPMAVFINRNNLVVFVNPAAIRLFGADHAEEIIGRDPYSFFLPEYHPQMKERIEKLLHGGSVEWVEQKLVQLDGNLKDIEVVASCYTDEDGPAIQVILQDITDRKRKENELHRLNRTLTALGHSNQAMMKAGSEKDYLNEVCRIVVEDCGHAMAWIGYCENDENKSVTSVAYAGADDGYLETVNITWADTERGQGPTGTAIRTSKPTVCRNMTTDPKFKPWLRESIKRGYASSVVLPLVKDINVFGAFTIYSRQVDSFVDEEVNLLSELATNLSFGISAFRLREEHDEIQEALRLSEERFRLALKNAPVSVAVQDQDLQFIWNYNQRTLKSDAEVIGKKDTDLFIPEEAAQLIRLKRKVLETGKDLHEQIWLTRGDKQVFLDLFLEPIRDPQGQITGIGIATVDLTAQKKIENELNTERSNLQMIFDTVNVGMFLVDETASVQRINSMVKRWFSKDAMTVYGKQPGDVLDCIHALSDPEGCGHTIHCTICPIRNTLLTVLTTGLAVHEVEARGKILQNGSVKEMWFDLSADPLFIDGKKHVILAMNNITERKLAEQALQISEEKSRNLIKYAPTGIYEIDLLGERFISINDAACRMIGYTREEIMTLNPMDFMDPESSKQFRERINRKLTGEWVEDSVEYRIKVKDGTLRVFLISIGAITYKNRKPESVLVIANDVTEKKRMEEMILRINSELEIRVEQRTAQLETAMKEMEAYSYSISHDLRAPLRHLTGFVALLKLRVKDELDEKSRHYLDVISDSAVNMGKLIDDILSYSRIGRTEMTLSNVNMNHLVEKSRELLQSETINRNIEWKISPLPEIMGDPVMLKIVMTNLLSNAIKFTRNKQHAKIEVGYKQPDPGEIVFYVKDNGAGFNEEYRDKLFKLFQRLHRIEEFEGTGLGLAIIKRIIQRHDGRVWAEGIVDEGATFFFSLPKEKPRESDKK